MATKTSRPRLGFLIAAAFALSATVMPTKVKAADVYFDAVASPTGPSFFSYAGNWWTDSSSTVGTFPSSGDDLFFGFGSGNLDNTAIYSDLGPAFIFNSITFSNADGLGSRGFYATTGADILRTSSINSFLGAGNITFDLPEVELIGPFAYIAAGAGSSIVFTDMVSAASPSGLTITGDGNTTISGDLLVNGVLKTGAGTLALGSGSYTTGFIDVLDGTVNFTQAGVMVDASVTNDSLLNFTNTSGVAGVSSLGGNGTTTFSGAASIASFSGTGTLSLNGNSSILSLSGNADVNIAITKTLEVASGSFSGNLSGLGDFKKVADGSPSGGTLVLGGNNLGLSGDILIEAGVVQAEFLWALGAGNVVLSGGDLTLVSDNSQFRANNVEVSADATITIEAFTPGTLSLTQQLGNLSIGANTLDVVQGPNFALGASSTLGFGNVTLASAGGTSTFNVVGDARLEVNNVTSFANESLTIAGAGTTLIFGTLDLGTGDLTKNGSGDLVVFNPVSGAWTGTTSVNGGLLYFASAVTLAGQVTNDADLRFADSAGLTELTTGLNGSGSTIFDGAALIGTRSGNGTQTFFGNTSIGTLDGQGLIEIASGKTLTVNDGDYFGTLEGAGNLTKSGAGVLRMFGAGAGDYTGTTTVNGGALAFESPVTLAGQVTNNATLVFYTPGFTNELTAGLDGSGNTQFFGDAVIGTRDGNGSLDLFGNASINTLLGTGQVIVRSGNTLDVSNGSFSGDLNGAGNLSKSGLGTLFMNGLAAANYTGTTTVNNGTLQFDSAVTLAGQVTNDSNLFFTDSLGVTTLTTGLDGSGYTRFWGDAVIGQRSGSGYLELDGNTAITTLNGSGTVEFHAPTSLQVSNGDYAGQFWGAGSLDKVSGGTLVLSGSSNSFSGDVNVLGGTLEAQSDRALGTGLVRLNGGNLAITSDTALLLGNTVEQLNSATVTLGAATVGATAVTQSLGNLSMRNGSYLVVQQDGSFAAGAPATLSVGTVNLDGAPNYGFDVGSGAKLEVRGAVVGNPSNTLWVSGAGDTTITGNLDIGLGALEKYDTGTLRLLSANSFSGYVDVYGGTLITANNGLQNVPQIYVHSSGTLNGVNYKTDADLAIDQGGTATFSAAASAITGTIWNNGNLTLNPALGGNSTITLNEFYGSGTTTITRGNLAIYNNALTLGPSVLDPFTYDNTLPADLTWGYGAGGGGLNSLTLIGTLTADISGGTVNTTNLFANYIFDVDMLGDYLNGTTGRPLGIAGPAMGGTNVFLNVNVSGSATVGRIIVDGSGTVNFAGTAEVVTLENGQVNLTGTLGEFTNVEGGAITSTSADVKITHLTGGTHSFNGQSTTITNFTGGTASLNGVQALVTTFGGTATATATSNISVGTMNGGSLTLQGSGPSSFITRLDGGTLNINGSDVLVTVNAGNSPAIGAGADISGNGSLTKLTVATLNLNTINLSGTTRHQEGTINVWGDNNSLGTVINSSTLNFLSNTGSNSIASLQGNSTGVINFATDSSIGEVSGSGVLTINDGTKTLTIQGGSFSGTISGAGNLFKSNAGVLVLSGTNVDNYTGQTTVNGGTLEFSSAVTLTGAVYNAGNLLLFTSATGTTTLSSLLNDFSATTIFTGASSVTNVTNANGSTLRFNGATNITGSLNNLFGGFVEINAGGTISVLQGDSVTRINNVGVSINQRFNDGELQVYASSTINELFGNGRITLGSTLSVNSGATAGIIDGNGSLTKNGVGLLTLSGANVDNYSGNTTVNNGTLEFAHDGVFLAGQVSVGGSGTLNFTASTGTTQLNGGLVTSGNTFIGNNAILADTYNYGNNLTIVGNVTGNHYLESSAGSATTVIGGTALLSHLRNYAGVIDINGLAGSSSIALIQNFAVTNIAGEVSGNTIQNYAGLTIGGNATFGDVRTYSGTTSIGGNLINCNYLENNSSTQVVGNASITSLRNYSGITTIGGALTASDVLNNGGQLINVTGNANITSQIENNGTANFGSTSTIWSLWGSGTANFAGAAQIQYRTGNGTANFADDSNVWSLYGDGSVTIASGKTLTLSTNYFWGSLSGDGSISKITGDTLVLGGSNVDGYQGSTTVNAGALVFDTASTLAGQVTNNATLSFTSGSGLTTLTTGLAGSGATTFAGDTSVGTLNGTGDATVSIANGKTLTVSNGSYAGTLNGAGSLVKANGGTLVFTGVNADDYQGSTTVDAGTLTFTQAVTLASQVTNNATLNFTNAGNTALTTGLAGTGATNFSGDTSVGTLDGTNTASVSIAGGKVLTVNSGSFAGSLTGGGSLVKSTGGSLTLSGVGAGNYVGTTTVDAGTLEFTQDVSLFGAVTNNSTLNFGGAGTTTLTGGLTGSGTTTFSGNGSITSRSGTGVVNFLGDVAIANVTGSGDLNIASGKSLTIQQGVYSGSITGSGDLVKTTGGELELIGSSSNYGATVVQAGLLTVNSDVTTSGVTVAAGASLGGSGTINGNVVVNGFLAPGNSPGILTVNGTETLANNSSFLAEIGGSTAGTGDNFHDQSNVVGNVVIGTGVDLDILSWNGFTSVARGDALTLVKATGGIAGTFADTVGSGLTGWTLFDNSSDAAHQFGNLYGTGLSAAQTFGAWGTNANRTAVAGALWTTAVTETTNSATTAGANRVGFIDTNSNAGRAALALVNAGANTDALLDSYSPESFLGLTDYAQMTARTLADGALNQTTSYTLGDWGVGAGYSSVANTFTAGSSSAFDRRLSSNTSYANFSYHLNPRWKAGLFFGHNVGSINSAANSTNLNGNVVGLSLNGSVDWHYPVSLKAAISSSSLRFGSTRTMTTATSGDDQIVSGSGSSSSADTKLTDTSAQVSASMLIYTKGRLSLSPSVGLVYGTSKTDAFTETGTGANLAVAGMSSNSTRGVIGLGIGYEVSAELALSMSLGLEKKLNSDADSVSATFAGARDANFSVVGRDTSGSVISTLGLGVSYRLPDGYSANLNAEFRSANPFHNDKRVNLSINRRF